MTQVVIRSTRVRDSALVVSAAYRKEGEGEGASAADPPGSYLDIDLRTGLPHFKSSAAAPIPASSQTNTQYYQAVPPTPLAGLPPLPLPPLPAQQPDDMSLAQAQMLAARAQQMQQQQAQVLQQLEATEQLQLQAAAAGRLGTSLPNSTTAAITPPTVTPTPLSAATPPSTHYLQLQDQHRQQQSMQQVAAQQHAMEVSAQREAALQQQRQELQLAWQELAAQRAQLQAAQLSIMEQKQRMEAAAHAAHEQQVAAARRQASAQEAQRGQDQAGQGRGQGGGQQQQSGQQGLLQHQVKEAGRSNRHEARGDSEERQLQRLLREADVQMGELRRQEQRSLAGQQGAGAVPGLGFEAQGSGFPSQATQPQMEQSGGSSWSGAGQDCQAQPQAQAHRAAGSDAFGPGGQQAAQQKEQQQREQQQREQQQREQQQQLAQQQQQEQLERDQQEAHRQQAHEQQQQQQEKEQQQQEQAEKAARAAQEQQARQLQKQQEEALALAADQAYDMKNYAMEAVGGGTQEAVVVGRLAASLLGLLSIGALGGCAVTLMKPDMEVALTANKITAMYSGPSPFSALDFPELTAFTNVAGPGSCLVYNGSGHLALQPHGSGSMTVSDEADSDSEDEEEVGSRQAAADMETTFGENEEEEGSELGSEPVQLYAIPPKGRRAALVPACDFQQHVDSAKQELAATADAVVRDLHSRFLPPEHAKGLAVVYAHYWDKQPSDEDFLERLAIVKARYCMDATLADGQLAPALLDQQKLSAQQSAFVEVMRCQAEHRVQLSSAAANPAKETTKLWRYLAGQPITKADILEYIKLAELALVMTPGSVEEERMFSAMAYLKDDTRNRLQECHLNVFEMLTGAVIPDQETFGLLLCAAATLAPIATALMQLCRLSDYHLAGSQLGMQLSYACLMWGLTNAASVASAVWQAAGVTDVMAGWFAACALTALTAAHVLRRALVTSQQVTVVSADGALIQARPHLAKRLFVGIKSSLVAVLSFFVPRTLPSALFAFSSLACFGVGLAVALPDLQDQVLGGRWLASVAQLTDTTPEAMPAAFAARLLVAGWYAASTLFYSLKELADKRLMSSPAARMLSSALGLMACTNAGLLLLGIKIGTVMFIARPYWAP
ncbi:hypothetical protein QJQ45_021962 [Haematococcus lacustris]|nr:hypothetical protein QJQ45_021962 [Haematococcus lacustris]